MPPKPVTSPNQVRKDPPAREPAPEEAPEADPNPGHNPCATFQDIRRDYCERMLNGPS